MSRGRDDRRDPWVELSAPVRLGRRDLGQLVVASGKRDTNERDLVDHVDREHRHDRSALLVSNSTERCVRRCRIAVSHRQQGEQPCRLAAEVGGAVLEKPPRQLSGPLLSACVPLMQRDPPQGDDSRCIKSADEAIT